MIIDRADLKPQLVAVVLEDMATMSHLNQWSDVLVWNGGNTIAHTFRTTSRWWLVGKLVRLTLTIMFRRSR